MRNATLVLLVPAADAGFKRAFFLCGGRVAAVRSVPPGPGARIELETGIAEALHAQPSLAPEHADELLVVAKFLQRPPPELQVLRFDELERVAA